MNNAERNAIIGYYTKGDQGYSDNIETVFGELEGLDSIPNYLVELAGIEIVEERRKIIDRWKDIPLIEKTIRKEILIPELVLELEKDYHTWKPLFPMSNDGKKFYRRYNDIGLDKILYPLDKDIFEGPKFPSLLKYIFNSYTMNATTFAIAGILFTGFLAHPSRNNYVNYISHMPLIAIAGVGGAMLGFLMNMMQTSCYFQVLHIDYLKKSSQYLQKRIEEYILYEK